MIRARILVHGDVQKVGFRDYVQKVARGLGVKGYVENLEDGTVLIVCEADEAVLEDFIGAIDVREEFIKVEKVLVAERSEATGEFGFFRIKHGDLGMELGERMGTAIEYARSTRLEIREMRSDLKGSIEGMHGDLKKMHVDLKESIDDMHVDLKDSIKEMHGDLKKMHVDLKEETAGVRNEIKGMRGEMNERFVEMGERYGVISAELVRTREELTRAVDNLSRAVEEFINLRRRGKIDGE